MSTIITTIAPTDRASDSRADINANFRDRHSLDITAIDDGDSPYTALTTDQCIMVDASAGAVTVALSAVAGFTNRSLIVFAKSVAGGNVTIDPNSSETINGASTLVLSAANTGKRIWSDGTAWFAI